MSGFRIGTIFGVEIRIDYSWFVIFFLILWSLTRGLFPSAHPGQTSLTYLLMGIAATLLFFGSLLAHELSHSMLARSRGMPVEGITLFIFGGMARTTGEFQAPRDEFMVAAAGPIASIVIAALFWVSAWTGVQLGLPAAVTGVASYLAVINLILAIFNLFPGFPLDGGRLFRAVVWQRTGDLRRATRIAANGGKIFGYTLMALGLLNLFGGGAVGGLWLIFIGWFVRTAAESSYLQYVLRESLASVRAQDVMTPDPETVSPDVTLQQFIDEYVFDGRHHSYPVVTNGRAVGLMTLERVRKFPREDWSRRTVQDAMLPATAELVVAPQDSMLGAMDKLSTAEARRILVTQDDRLVGIIAHTDVTRWLDRERLRTEMSRAGRR